MLNRRDVLRNISWLAGGAIITPALLHGCNNEPALGWKPAFFSDDEARFVTAYIDTLLPTTDTPGGLDVGVDRFIDKVMAATNADTDELLPMQTGIRDFDEDARTRFGKVFHELEADQRGQLFSDAEKSPRYQPAVWGTAVGEQPPIGFYRSFKSMVLWGYLSSEQIGTEVLVYDPVPGEYDGDMPLSATGGRSWSL
ncbi:gluconate 2-dehydrogenase subunit 3-like protein [Neolewinella xylanilytica]|uniref:Gluconate 2-dehydrogenase subunit 3-like protein n=1 Tax=Neolewinella xylanilytica TaxID=1514080 RepID=A0A2S6I769_9BACT|nr:gluconate 2-dehydrogenase subunit 3 family protein [Neolewinella xylanilytica]PPK87299.1 gluconate 2-dehydrogenase subunit 3-like protein [Neolewinella xylanilytica]